MRVVLVLFPQFAAVLYRFSVLQHDAMDFARTVEIGGRGNRTTIIGERKTRNAGLRTDFTPPLHGIASLADP